MKILIGITGSVAGKLTPKLHEMLTQRGHEVKLVFTQNGKFFVDKNFLCFVPMLNNKNIIWFDESSEFFGETYDDNLRIIKHIELRDWADVFLICPCSANTISKISVGICDNLLTSIFRAWDFNKPIFIAPSMNTKMWEHPVTGNSLKIIESWGVRVIQPVVKKLACGETGVGALADLDFIVKEIEEYQPEWQSPFKGGIPYIPLPPHKGAFGQPRHRHCHTGVDLYCDEGTDVFCCEPGVIVDIGQFTGREVGCDWWNDTWYVSIQGKSGIICYGEIVTNPILGIGVKVDRDTVIGQVIRVIKNLPKQYVEGHRPNMLHLELMKTVIDKVNTSKYSPDWEIGKEKPDGLIDPTPYLLRIKGKAN